MRRLNPRPKDRRKVSIPVELREAMREVFELIQQAKHDSAIVLDYDDSIQVGAVCGGRSVTNPRFYVLVYRPTGDAAAGRWSLSLHESEIEDIGDGRMTEVLMSCCTSVECRRKFRTAGEHCAHCDYDDDPEFGTFAFPAAGERLSRRGIAGLTEASTQKDVLATLGPPHAQGGDVRSPLGYVGPWLTYTRDDCQIRFEFGKHSRLKNITVMEKDWQPGR